MQKITKHKHKIWNRTTFHYSHLLDIFAVSGVSGIYGCLDCYYFLYFTTLPFLFQVAYHFWVIFYNPTNEKDAAFQQHLSDCRQSNFEAAEGLGKQIRFPNGIRSRNSFPTRKTASFEAFKLMELVCLFLCLSKSKSWFRLRCRLCRHLETPAFAGVQASFIHRRLA